MTGAETASWEYWLFLHLLLEVAMILRVLAREDRDPAARMAWVLVILAVPFAGVLAYLMFGEARIARKPMERMGKAQAHLPKSPASAADLSPPAIPATLHPAFARAAAANGFSPLAGNRQELMTGANGFVDRLVADIDAAERHVHAFFYIWLDDRNGTRVAEALMRAAARGVDCRVMVDALGSRKFCASPLWSGLRAGGVRTGAAFPISFPLLRLLISRIDIRNHRKIVVIDHRIAYAGSQNCADAAFALKPRYAPWVDIMVRVTGPVVWQFQQLFVSDWITHEGEDIAPILAGPAPVAERPHEAGLATAVAVGSGPEINKHTVSDLFQAVIAAAQDELLITTPYYVPNEALNQQICAAAVRGVRVRMILPARNDSRIVALASRSYYRILLSAGVELYEYRPGLLHAKILVADGAAVLVGSANMDRRSFELNYENCLLSHDPGLAGALDERIASYLAESRRVTAAEVRGWWLPRRILQNLIATFGPVL